jgi:hypothetical protein
MADSVFDLVAEEIERRTDLARLEARGTLRIALREAGLDARNVTASQMSVLLQKVMPREMRSRGIDDAEGICNAIAGALASARPLAPAPDAESPEAIFRRLAGS